MYPVCPYMGDHVRNKETQQSRAVDSFAVFMPTTAVVDINIVTPTCS